MHIRKIIPVIALAFAARLPAQPVEGDSLFDTKSPDSGVTTMLNIRCAEDKSDDARKIVCYFTFTKSTPSYFYDVDTINRRVILSFMNSRLGGFTFSGMKDTFLLGPVRTIRLDHELRDKNEAVKGLKPEWYDVVVATIDCKPMIVNGASLELAEKKSTISLAFPWPLDPAKRNTYYTAPRKTRYFRELRAPLAAVGAAGALTGGYFIWKFFSGRSSSSGELDPVLPIHP